jgi:hypothetical protein
VDQPRAELPRWLSRAAATETRIRRRFEFRDVGTLATGAEEAARMVGLPSASLDPLWRLLDVPIRWVSDAAVDPNLERPLEYLELTFLALVLGLIVVVVWDITTSRAREEVRRAQQEQWQRQLKERKRRLKFEHGSEAGERLGPTQ